ncbi:hypothetical protein AB0M44_47900 [Streptosporangium subroseum]|uniref:hypothetical protein n=1 Tax=Streptosporangium subroseum TaxID=106412 RepID=UPI00342AE1C2
MRQTLGFIAVWCGATVLAISVAWFGVRDVLRSQVFDDVKIEPISVALTGVRNAPLPQGAPTGPLALGTPTTSATSSSLDRRSPTPRATPTSSARNTARPQPVRSPAKTAQAPVRTRSSRTPDPARTRATPVPRAVTSPSASSTPRATRSSAAPKPENQAAASNENVRVVNVKGGSVSFVIEDGACRLITAAPNAGYTAQVSQNAGWIRVDLVQGAHGSSVFCIGGENRTDLWEY